MSGELKPDFVHDDLVVCNVGASGYGVVAKRKKNSNSSSIPPSPSTAAVVFHKGDLLVDCNPIVVQINGQFCHGCGAKSAPKKCGYCKKAYYCSLKCQSDSWSLMHEVECQLLRRNDGVSKILQNQDRSGRDVKIAAIIISKIRKELGLSGLDLSTVLFKDFENTENQVCLKDFYSSSQQPSPTLAIISLMSPPLTDDGPLLPGIENVSTLLEAVRLETPSSKDIVDNQKKTINLIKKSQKNSFGILNPEATGNGLYPFTHLFNHSCYFNATYVFHRLRHQLRAVQDIYEGDEIALSYMPRNQPKMTRVKQLAEGYSFKCECLVCHSEGPFQNAYNSSLENPLCPTCVKEYHSNPKSEPWRGIGARSPLLFSANWFDDLRSLCRNNIPYGCSASSVSNIKQSSFSFPSSVNSLLTNPPLMIKLSPTSMTRHCARCKAKETNGFFAAFDQPNFKTNLDSFFRLVSGTPTGLEMTEDCFQKICLKIVELLTQHNFDIMTDSSFPPQLFQFLLCSRTFKLDDCLTNLNNKCTEQQKMMQLLPWFLLSFANNSGTIAAHAFAKVLYAFGCELMQSDCGTVSNKSMLRGAIQCVEMSINIWSLYELAFKEYITRAETTLESARRAMSEDVVLFMKAG